MHCKNCGLPLNGNQVCPGCGTINELNNNVQPEQVVQENTTVEQSPVVPEAPTMQQPVEPSIETPVQPVLNSDAGYSYQAPKKKNPVLIIVLAIVGLLVVGVGVFFVIKSFGKKPEPTPVVEPTKEETKKSDEDRDAKYANTQIFIDKMTNEEILKFIRDNLNFEIVDGETPRDFYKRLAVSKTGKEPKGYDGGTGIDINFRGVVFGSTKRDYVEKIHISCKYTFTSESLYIHNLESDKYTKEGGVYFIMYDMDRANTLYESLKSQYVALYPGTSFNETKAKDGSWATASLNTTDNKTVQIHVEHRTNSGEYSDSELRVFETTLK